MRFSIVAALAASATGVVAISNGTEFTTTEVVTAYTTFCPAATTLVEGSSTFTVTTATTLTISNCPCTRTKTFTSAAPTSLVSVPIGTAPASSAAVPSIPSIPLVSAPAPAGTAASGTGSIPSPSGGAGINGTTPGASGSAASPPAPSAISPATGGANRAGVAAGALAGLIGVAAYLL